MPRAMTGRGAAGGFRILDGRFRRSPKSAIAHRKSVCRARQAVPLLVLLLAACSLSLASNTGGTGTSTMGCVGFAPWPCARQDHGTTQDSLPVSFVPVINQPFIDTFGERMVRVSSITTPCDQYPTCAYNTTFVLDSLQAGMGSFDSTLGPNGGYRFYFDNTGGAEFLFWIDPVTLQSTWIYTSYPSAQLPLYIGARGSASDPRAFYGTGTIISSSTTAVEVYCAPPGTGTALDPACSSVPGVTNFAAGDSGAVVYDFANCPNLPSIPGTHQGAFSLAQDGSNAATLVYGGGSQDWSTFAFYYNPTNGHCDWYDTQSGQMGGTDYIGLGPGGTNIVQSNGVMPAPTVIGSGSGATSSSNPLAADTYDVAETFVTFDRGIDGGSMLPLPETLASPATVITVGAG
ncbi:MAG: hypothetical protein ACRD3T_15855, partial [Terriglobia bacterium]